MAVVPLSREVRRGVTVQAAGMAEDFRDLDEGFDAPLLGLGALRCWLTSARARQRERTHPMWVLEARRAGHSPGAFSALPGGRRGLNGPYLVRCETNPVGGHPP